MSAPAKERRPPSEEAGAIPLEQASAEARAAATTWLNAKATA